MNALVERIIAARDRIEVVKRDHALGSSNFYDLVEAKTVMADAANALTDTLAALKLADKWMGEFNHPPEVGATIRAAIAKAEPRQ